MLTLFQPTLYPLNRPVKNSNASTRSGYCTNVHPGTNLRSILENLERYAGPARTLARPSCPLGIGLWVPAEATHELVQSLTSMQQLGKRCESLGLEIFTFNGFPYGNFHEKVVKHRVYEPSWAEPARLQYTQDLIAILDNLLPPQTVGSISTLPIGWGQLADASMDAAAKHLQLAAQTLRQLEEQAGRRIVIAIEPEPGCTLDTAADVIAFFDSRIPPHDRRYITVCHDICHSAVMFESQQDVLRRYAQHDITVGKFQISSAIAVPWSQMTLEERAEAAEQLRSFAEDRYLHQTGRKTASGDFALTEDLPHLLGNSPPHEIDDTDWCIHFHVPIHLRRFGQLHATQDAIVDCLTTLKELPADRWIPHFEVETYAWGVLPETMRQSGLAESIAAEIRWFDQNGLPLVQ